MELPHDQRTAAWLERATTLLMNQHYSIAEIAEELGYDEQGFIETFTTIAGESPACFRKRPPPTRSI